MKAEINNENKAKFFALYWDQDVISSDMYGDGGTIYSATMKTNSLDGKWLSLKPLSKISNEDAIEVGKILYKFFRSPNGLKGNEYHLEIGKNWIEKYLNGNRNYLLEEVSDYLRSKGYALPWMGLSVDEMVNAGWIKLTEQ